MKSIHLATWFFSLAFFMASCQQASEASFQEASTTMAKEASFDQSDQKNADLENIPRKIIKTASIRFQVEDVKSSYQRIEEMVKEAGGFITQSESSQSSYQINYSLSVRIPTERLEAFLPMLEKEAVYLDYSRIQSQDVTEEYLDIETRLRTKKEVRDRYVQLLRERAQTVEDILNAEEKIRVIQEEIESIEGRLNYLSNQVTLSTVHIDMYQKVPYQDRPDLSQRPMWLRVKNGFVDGWYLIQDIAVGMIGIWPILLIFVLLIWQRKRIRGLFRRSQ